MGSAESRDWVVAATQVSSAARTFLQAAPATPSGILRRRLAFAAKLAVTLAAFWIVLALIDLDQAVELIRDQDPALVASAAIAIVAQVMLGALRWHPVTRGFGFQAEIVCMLLAVGATYKEIPVRTVELKGGKSRALTLKNWLSVTHTLITIVTRRLSNWVYR